MKKFAIKSLAVAAAAVCAGAAFAGSITTPATDALATPYAVESLTNSTALRTTPLVYTMGVGRTTVQGFTIIYTPSAGATFSATGCSVVPVVDTTPGNTTVTIKRQSAAECAYDVAVNVDLIAGRTFTWTPPLANLATHTLATSGNNASLSVNLWDTGETARVDNSSALTRRVATSGNALTLTAVADTATIADVNDSAGPLFGFLANGTVPSDTTTVARADFSVGNNSGLVSFLKPDGATAWNYVADGTSIAVTVTGNFAQLAAGGFLAASAVGPASVTATPTSTTGTFSLAPTNTGAAGTNTLVTVSFTTARTASMGTARTFGVSALGDVITGADVALAGNAGWWVWGANASQLMTPYFTTNSLFLSRFFLLNTGSNAVTYSAVCYAETAATITYGAGRTGTLAANGLTAVNASNICTFGTVTRGSVIFTVNAPINTVKGSYQYIDPVSLNGVVQPLTRPYNQANTTE